MKWGNDAHTFFGMPCWHLLICFSAQSPVFAESYSDVVYQNGFPGFIPGPFIGTVSIESTGVSFETRTGKRFLIPRQDIRQFGYNGTVSQSKYRGLTLATGSPIALAASLGITVLENTLIRSKPKANLFYSIRFVIPDNAEKQEVVFKIPNEKTAKQMMADLQNLNQAVESTDSVIPAEEQNLEPIPAQLQQ